MVLSAGSEIAVCILITDAIRPHIKRERGDAGHVFDTG